MRRTEEPSVTVRNFWDKLQRLTISTAARRPLARRHTNFDLYYCLPGQAYSNSSGDSRILVLTAMKDRLTNWRYFANNAVRQETFVTKARPAGLIVLASSASNSYISVPAKAVCFEAM